MYIFRLTPTHSLQTSCVNTSPNMWINIIGIEIWKQNAGMLIQQASFLLPHQADILQH